MGNHAGKRSREHAPRHARTQLALEGLVVLELGHRVGASACGSLLAQLGATVIVVEPHAITPPDAGSTSGVTHKWQDRVQFLAGKASFAPDLENKKDRLLLGALFEHADVILQSSDVDPAELCAALPPAGAVQVVCDLTAFGQSGPFSGQPWPDVALQAMTGILGTTGLAGGPPVPVAIPVIEYLGGTHAAGAVLAALRVARQSGQGQAIDIALYDCGFAAMSSFLSRLLCSEESGAGKATRLGNLHTLSAPWNVYQAQDGWVLICTGSNLQWQRLCELMGQPELVRDARFVDASRRVAHVGEVDAVVQNWIAGQQVAACVDALGSAQIPAGPIAPVDRYPREENLLYRGMVQVLSGALAGAAFAPGSPLRMSRTPGVALTRVPAKDADRDLLNELLHRPPSAVSPASAFRESQPPLQGVRVLEIGHYTTAPVGARSLAALGADVIKIEPPDGEAARAWDPVYQGQSIFYTVSNSDKSGITIDLNSEQDRHALRSLLESADVLIENLKPGTLAKFGFHMAELERINPRLVYCAISGFGAESLYSGRPAFDTVVQGMSGLMSLIVSNGIPLKTGISYSDVIGAAMSVVAILAALEYRERSGVGQFIDLSMQDITAWTTQLAWNRHPVSVGWQVVSRDGRDMLVPAATDCEVHPAVPIRTPAEVLACAHTQARALRCTTSDERGQWPGLAVPLGLVATPPQVSRPGPGLGQHNDLILGPLRSAAHS